MGIVSCFIETLPYRHPCNAQREHLVQAWIVFPYYKNGQLVNAKYRTTDKRFRYVVPHRAVCHAHHRPRRQVSGAEKVLYGYDDVVNAPEVIIVEGEMDKLSLEEAGFRNVVSVPDGAPARVKVCQASGCCFMAGCFRTMCFMAG